MHEHKKNSLEYPTGQTIKNESANVPVLKLKPPVCQTSIDKGKTASRSLGEDIFKLYIMLQ